jgi:hypothetical protein
LGQDNYNFEVKATGSTTLRKVKDRWADVINVKDFGAVPNDYTKGQVNHTAFQAALNYYASVTTNNDTLRKTIHIPAGVYIIGGILRIHRNTTLQGEGRYATTLVYWPDATASDFIVTDGYYDATKEVENCQILDLAVYGRDNVSKTGINLKNCASSIIKNVMIQNFDTALVMRFGWCNLLESVFCNNNRGVGIYSGYGSNVNTLINCNAVGNGLSGIVLDASCENNLISCAVETNGQYGVVVTNSKYDNVGPTFAPRSAIISGCSFEGNNFPDILIKKEINCNKPRNVLIRDNYFCHYNLKPDQVCAIRIMNVEGCIIEGNLIDRGDFGNVPGDMQYPNSIICDDTSGVVFGFNIDKSIGGRTACTYEKDIQKATAFAFGSFYGNTNPLVMIDAYNIQNITKDSTRLGHYIVTMSKSIPSQVYAVVATAENGSGYYALLCSVSTYGANSFHISVTAPSGVPVDGRIVSFLVFTTRY